MAVWSGLATAAILLVIDGLLAGRSLVGNLTRARSELNVGIEAIVTGDPEGARPHFAAAVEAADRATSAVRHPALDLAGLFPVAGENLDAAAGVAAASKETAMAGTAMVDVARTLGWSDVALPAATRVGRLDLDAMRAAVPLMDTVVARLRDAASALEAAGGGGLLGPVATGYRDTLEHLERRADLSGRLRDTLSLASAMFGADGPRRYLLVVPSLGIPRPEGGAAASVGVLAAERGIVRMESLSGSREGALEPAAPELAGATGSPDGPTAARRLLAAVAEAGGPELDGVVWLDAEALEDLVWVTGDVRVAGRRLSDMTTTTAMEIDAYLGSAPRIADQLHADWASRIVRRFLARRPGLESFALAGARSARERHLGIFLVRDDEQRLVSALGLDRAVPRPEAGVLPVVVTWSADGANHVGAFVTTRIRYEVTLRSNGSARVLTEVTLENGAGVEPPSVLLGRPGSLVPVGSLAAEVGVLVPENARQLEAETSRPAPISIEGDLGYASVNGSVTVRGGAAATLTITYVVRDALESEDGDARIAIRLFPQPTLEGIPYSIRVGLPDGTVVASASPEFEVRGDAATFSGIRTSPVDLELVLTA